ncbi:pyridoxal-phosphate-dependent aminotransferase family protein [Methanotorris formicicus]|uniref:Aminotransferase class V n=1 Tax=Methanotorris formicicus Mc-S-70 TaxID=647171 RepID=H1L1I1_9EURY|nr:alanine--glyoxylate aminotransferase family protein [Methanotorris formicicus]EHP83703.1 aminotransferase class V [Methanotorris formicicus Mc-S-70]
MKIDTEKLLMIPGPTMVPAEVLNAMALPIIGHRTGEFGELLVDTTEKMKKVFQTKNDTFIITGSGTAAMDMAILNVIDKGDKVLNIVNGNFGDRFAKITLAYKGESIKLENEWGDMAEPEAVKEILDKHDDIKAVTIVHNETSTGARNPIKDIGEIVKDYDALYIVDTVSSLGGDYVDVDKFNIDICVTGSQKCLAAPPGLSAITVSEKAWEVIEKTEKKSLYLDLEEYKKKYNEKKQTPYTPAVSLIYALNVALDLVLEEGLENRFKRHEKLAKATTAGLEAMGIELFAKERARSVTVTSAYLPKGVKDKEFRGLLSKKYNVVIAGGQAHLTGKIFRIGHMGTAKEIHILATLGAIEMALKELGVKVENGVEVAEEILMG